MLKFTYLNNGENESDYMKNNYGDLLNTNWCKLEVESKGIKMTKILIPDKNKKGISFTDTNNHNSSKFVNFVNDIKNNTNSKYYFNTCNGYDGFEYENKILKILLTNYASNLFVEVDISDNIDDICNKFIEFDQWVNNL